MGTVEGYLGYGQDQGLYCLREKIAHLVYRDQITPDEIFISDGAKCDIGRLQMLFGSQVRVGLQDPAYPVYYDGSFLQGVRAIHFLPCLPENRFIPDLKTLPPLDLLYLCNPNNPTGAAYTYGELKQIVEYAQKHRITILYDGVYSGYIQNTNKQKQKQKQKQKTLPRSIFEIEGGREVGIEINSLSKTAGFSGIRLGWSVVPKTVTFECGSAVWEDWHRLSSTLFNGPSSLSQQGALAAFEEEGQREVEQTIHYYLTNAALLKKAFIEQGYTVYGGEHAPYPVGSHTEKKIVGCF